MRAQWTAFAEQTSLESSTKPRKIKPTRPPWPGEIPGRRGASHVQGATATGASTTCPSLPAAAFAVNSDAP